MPIVSTLQYFEFSHDVLIKSKIIYDTLNINITYSCSTTVNGMFRINNKLE